MADTVGGKRARGKKNPQERMEGELSLEFIQDLGGTKDDLRLLADLGDEDDEEDLIQPANDFEAEPIKREELHSFWKQLGIADQRPEEWEKIKKAKKLLTAPVEEDSDDEPQTSQTPATDDPQTKEKQKKKEKNKFKTEKTVDSPESEKQKKSTEAEPASENASEKKKKKKKEKNKFKVQHSEISSTTANGEEELRSHLKTSQQRTFMLVKPGDSWLDHQMSSAAEETTKTLVQQCERFVAKLLEDEVALYKKQREKNKRGESHWIKTVLSSGTLSDKMAALMVLVQESPLHNLNALDMLIAMANKKGKREAMLASDTLKSLFVSETSPLPDDRKLITFDARPFGTLWHSCSGNRDSVNRRMMTWYAEDLLRQKYAAFVKALDVMSYDTLEASKEKSLGIMHSLLTSKPEQEKVLLPMLVNKLGDPNHKIASKTSYLLIRLMEEHPNMKHVIVAEVERLVYRPNITERAQYYAMCYLNQIKLHKSDQTLASQLISIYFSFFKVCVKKGEADSKMMAALLTGVNRAYPYAKVKQDFMTEQVGMLYKIVHIVNFNISIQALMLLFHVIDPSNSESDRFFMALYRKLLDPGLKSSAKQPQFLNLLYRSMKADVVEKRVVVCSLSVCVVWCGVVWCGVVWGVVCGVVWRSMKADVVEKRVVAMLKRLLQAGSLLGPNFLCGALIIASEVLKERPHLLRVQQMGKITQGKTTTTNMDFDDDEEEKFVDLPVPLEFQDSNPQESNPEDTVEETTKAVDDDKSETAEKQQGSWLHRQNLTDQRGYDCYQRNPLHSHAQNECLWELQALTRHFHPSVSLFAGTVLKGRAIEYSSDPLQDFTLIRFLDRFVLKNPKKKDIVEGRSETVGTASGKRQQRADTVPVNSAEFLQGGEEAVPEHERYLYRYFSQKAVEKKKKEEDAESETSSVSDTEFDDFLDKHERQLDHDDLGDMDFGMDFAGNMKDKKKSQKGKASKNDSSDEDMEEDDDDDGDGNDDGDDIGGLSDEEIDFGDDEDDELAAEFRREMEGLGDMEDGEEKEDLEDEDLSGDELKQMMGGRKRKSEDEVEPRSSKKSRRSDKNDLASMFAAADDFADVLEGNADINLATLGTGDAMSNNDKASAKQIAWEMKRDGQSQRKNWRDKKHRGGKLPKGGHRQKRRK
ncbi:hypothetical protein ACOMHN_012796 [Nucella lapillus]